MTAMSHIIANNTSGNNIAHTTNVVTRSHAGPRGGYTKPAEATRKLPVGVGRPRGRGESHAEATRNMRQDGKPREATGRSRGRGGNPHESNVEPTR